MVRLQEVVIHLFTWGGADLICQRLKKSNVIRPKVNSKLTHTKNGIWKSLSLRILPSQGCCSCKKACFTWRHKDTEPANGSKNEMKRWQPRPKANTKPQTEWRHILRCAFVISHTSPDYRAAMVPLLVEGHFSFFYSTSRAKMRCDAHIFLSLCNINFIECWRSGATSISAPARRSQRSTQSVVFDLVKPVIRKAQIPPHASLLPRHIKQ